MVVIDSISISSLVPALLFISERPFTFVLDSMLSQNHISILYAYVTFDLSIFVSICLLSQCLTQFSTGF